MKRETGLSRSVLISVAVATTLASGASLAERHYSPTLTSPSATGQNGPQNGDKIPFCGKVVPLVEVGCLGIVSDTQTFELTAVTPRPVTGKIISGVGVVSTTPDICMQGIRFSAATWKEVTSC